MFKDWRRFLPSWLLPVFLVIVFLTGGASRADAMSLIVLRPLAVMFCFIGLLQIRKDHLEPYRVLAGIGIASLALVAVHLIPLPPGVWQALPGRSIVAELDAAMGQRELWRPLTLSPSGGWNALYSLSVPIASFLLALPLDTNRHLRLLALLIGLGMTSAVFGLLQVASSGDGPLYLYAVTNKGSAVGLFANRNHQAVLLAMLFPMIASYAAIAPACSKHPARVRWLLVGLASLLPPLLLVTGSRLGLICGGLGAILALAVYQRCRIPIQVRRTGAPPISQGTRIAGLVGGVILLTSVTAVFARAEAIRRILRTDPATDLRIQIWGPIWRQSLEYFPWGSGVGSFIPVYQSGEAREILQLTFVNHAHNDWLELWLTTGVPGIAILVMALAWVASRAVAIFAGIERKAPLKVEQTLALMGGSCLLLLMLGSAGDYPIRTPIMAAILPIILIFMQLSGSKADRPIANSVRAHKEAS